MSRARIAAIALALAAAAAQAAATWERKVEFARQVGTRSDRAAAESVLDALAADPAIPASERPDLYLALADCWFDLIAGQAGGKDGLEGAIHCLGKARGLLARFLELPAVKDGRSPAERRVEAALRRALLAKHTAACHARLAGDTTLPAPQKQQHRQEAVRSYESAIRELDALAAQKEDRARRLRARLSCNEVRVELAMFLKDAGSPEAQWRPTLEAAAKDYRQMLFDFPNPGVDGQINVLLAEALLSLGNDREALERLAGVWRVRADFAGHKAVPCKARYLAASALFRQGKPREAIDALDEMLVFRTRGGRAYDPKAVTAEGVRAVLEDLDDGDSPAQFDRREVAKALLLAAEAHAALGEKAREGQRPKEETQALFTRAYHLALGVCQTQLPLDTRYVPLLERWRQAAGQPEDPALLRRRSERAAHEGRYGEAARDLTAALAADAPEPDLLRRGWEQVAAYYYRDGDHYSAAIACRSLARRFPRPEATAYAYVSRAYRILRERAERTEDPADEAVADECGRVAERLSPQGPGPLHLKQALAERAAGRLDAAMSLLGVIGPASPVYPSALCEAAFTHGAVFEGLPGGERAGPRGQEALAAMAARFHDLLEHAEAALPKLPGDDGAGERRRILDPLARCLAGVCEMHLKRGTQGAAGVIELAAEAERACPGIAELPAFPFVVYARLRAADLLLAGSTIQEHQRLAATLEQGWTALAKHPDFRGLAHACWLAANACDRLAARLDEAAKTAPDPAAKADLGKQAAAARDRGLACYVQLVQVAPDQPIGIYRRVLSQLLERPHEPKSADYRQIANLGPKAVELHKALRDAFGPLSRSGVPLGEAYNRQPEQRPAIDLLLAESALGIAHCRLGNWRDALPLLEEVHRVAEAVHQTRLAALARDGRQERVAREALHLAARRWLPRCYLELAASSKYEAARTILFEDLSLYARDKPEHWDTLYWLCETLRREGRHEDALKLVRLDALRTQGAMGTGVGGDGKGTRDDFRRLVVQLQRDVARLDDPARRSALLASAAEALRQLGG